MANQIINVPAYVYPTSTDWATYVAGAPAVGFMIANPASGPGVSVDPNYTTGIANARAAGIKVIGYVHTSYGARALATVEADIDAWYSFYTIDGIMFDEVQADATNLSYYTSLYNYVKAKDAIRNYVALNPGTTPAESYMAISDTCSIFESAYTAWQTATPYAAWMNNYAASKLWIIVYSVPDVPSMQGIVTNTHNNNIGQLFLTDTSGYVAAPSTTFWNAEKSAMTAAPMTTFYGSSVHDTTITTACDMAQTTGGVETSVQTTLTGGSGLIYGEIRSQGGTGAGLAAIPTIPTGNGWVVKPGAVTYAAGTWSATITMSLASGVGSASNTTMRFFRYSGGTYYAIGSIVTNTAVPTTKTTYTFTATAMPSVTFGPSDLLYVDLWLKDNQSQVGNDNPIFYVSNSASAGVANDLQIATATITASSTQVKDTASRFRFGPVAGPEVGNPYGITIGASNASGTLSSQAIADMQTLGITWLRYQVPWQTVDATLSTNQNPSTYTWTAWDSAVSQCNAANINIILTIFHAPAQFQNSGNPDVPSYTATFAAQIASRYNGGAHGTVQSIEVGNEDYDSGSGTSATPLVATLKAVYPAVKAVSGSVIVGCAALLQRNSAHYTSFMETLLNPSTGAYIGGVFQANYLNFHYYTGIPTSGTLNGYPNPVNLDPTVSIPSWNGGAGLPSITDNHDNNCAWKLIQAKMTQYSLSIPLWLTETGWQINTNPSRNPNATVSQALQWQYLQDVLDASRTSGVVNKVFIFTLGYYTGYPAPNYRDGMSLVQGTSSSPTHTTAFTQLDTYIATYPHWIASPTTQAKNTASRFRLQGTGSLYGSSVHDATITTACDMAQATGGSETSVTTTFTGGSGLVYGEIHSQGGTVAGVTAIPTTPTGNGWVLHPGAGTYGAGNWSAVITMSLASGVGSASNTTIRFFRYSGGTYTSIGSIVTNTAVPTTKTTYTFAATAMPSVTFGPSDLLYIDLWFHDNQTNVGNDNPIFYISTSASAGVANDLQVTTSTFTTNSTVVKDVASRFRLTALNQSIKDTTSRFRLATSNQSVRNIASRFLLQSAPPFIPSNYYSTVLADIPYVYYRLGESLGLSAFDASGNGLTATASTSANFGIPGAIARDIDTAVQLDGSTSHLTASTALSTTGWSAITVECWINLTFQAFGNYPRIIANDFTSSTNHGIDLLINPTGAGGSFWVGNGSVSAGANWGTTFTRGTWYHLVGTWDGNTIRVYINGALAGSAGFSSIAIGAASYPLSIGYNPSYNGDYLAAIVDEVAIYHNVALSSTSIARHYAIGTSGATSYSIADARVYKSQVVRAYDPFGNYLDTIKDAPYLTGFTEAINAAPTSLKFSLPRRIDAYDGANMPNSQGTVVLGNIWKWYLYGPGLPSTGLLRYQGIVDTIRPHLDENGGESVEVTITPYGQILGDHGIVGPITYGTPGVSLTYVDTGTMFADLLQIKVDPYTGLSYGNPFVLDFGNVTVTGNTTQFGFQNQTLLSALTNIILLSPANYFFRMNWNNTISFNQYSLAIPDHTLTLGQHITSMEYALDNVPRKNLIVVQGKGVQATARGSSIGSIGERIYIKSDNRITDANTAQLLANGLLTFYDRPQIRTKVKIPDFRGDGLPGLGYDIEQFQVGQTVNILDAKAPAIASSGAPSVWRTFKWGVAPWGSTPTTPALWGLFKWGQNEWGFGVGGVFNTVVPIVAITYGYHYVELELGFRQPSMLRALYALESRFQDATFVT